MRRSCLVAVLSVLVSARPGQIIVQRRLPEHLSLGATNQVGWDIRNLASSPVQFELTEDVPEAIEREVPERGGHACFPMLRPNCVTGCGRRAAGFTSSATFFSAGGRSWGL